MRSVLTGIVLATAILCLGEQVSAAEHQQQEKADLHMIFSSDLTGIFQTQSVFGNVVPLALEHINNRSDILGDYNIVPHYMDTKCSSSIGLHEMYRMFYTPPTKIFIIGSVCSHVCLSMGATSHLWNITQITAACVDPALSDKTTYPRFFRNGQSELAMISTKLRLMEKYNWQKVVLLHQVAGPFPSVNTETIRVLANSSATIVASEVLNNDARGPIVQLQKRDARIILAGMFNQLGVHVFCEAYKLGFYGAHILWMLPGFWGTSWVEQGAPDTDCTEAQIFEVVQDAIYISSEFKNPDNTPSIAGYRQSDIDHLVDVWTNYSNPDVAFLAAGYFDATMAAALALNMTQEKLINRGDKRNISDFEYKDSDIADMIRDSMFELQFQGVKGRMRFDKNGDVPTDKGVFQQKGSRRVKVGWHDTFRDVIVWVNDGLTWRGGKPPVDSTRIFLEYVYVSNGLYLTMCAIAVFGICANIGLICFNAYYRDLRVIKMSSPNINSIILIGCIFSFSSVFFELREESVSFGNAMCILRTCSFVFGFSLAFGGLFSKTWRVHMILTKSMKSAKKTVISDGQLFLIVGLLVLVDAAVLVTWQVYSPYSVVGHNLTSQIRFGESMVVYQLSSCSSGYGTYFQGALFVIQGLMLAFGAFLAWETRKVKLEALNDSKFIGMCIYNVTILSILGAAINMVIKDNPDASYGFTSGFTVAGTFLTSCLLFVPKILHVKGIVSVVATETTKSTDKTTVTNAPTMSSAQTGD